MKDAKNYKSCRFCCEAIIKKENYCHYCLSDQRSWLKTPINWFSWAVCSMLLVMLLSNFGTFTNDFSDYFDQFTTTSINTIQLDKEHYSVVFKIENNTNKTWRDLTYQVIGTKKNNVIFTYEGNDYNWVALPKSTSYLTVLLAGELPENSWSLVINDLSEGEL